MTVVVTDDVVLLGAGVLDAGLELDEDERLVLTILLEEEGLLPFAFAFCIEVMASRIACCN